MATPPSSSASHRNTAAPRSTDNPGVRLPPPVLYLAGFLVGLVLQDRLPLPFLARPVALGLGLTLVAVGGLFIITSVPTMVRGHGTLNTAGPSAALVVTGPYTISRNPMYLGLVLVYSGLACLFAVTWALPIVVLLVLYTQFGVIAPEERYLDRAFGDSYRAYRSRVRRWL